MIRISVSIFFWILTAIFTIAVFLGTLFCVIALFPFDRKRKLTHTLGYWWADCLVAANPFWNVSIKGLENIDRHKAYVVVANHQSLADIVMLYKIHMQFKWVAKNALFKVPVFGWCMSAMKHIRLSRGEFASIRDVYDEAGDWLKKNVSVLFFPEGTRSTSAGISPFKNGAFKLAIKEKKPILPIYIEGTADIISRGSWIFNAKAICRLTVLPAIESSVYQPEEFAHLRDRVRESLLSAGRRQN